MGNLDENSAFKNFIKNSFIFLYFRIQNGSGLIVPQAWLLVLVKFEAGCFLKEGSYLINMRQDLSVVGVYRL